MKTLSALLIAGCVSSNFATAATILQNFEGVTVPAIPTGWEAVGSGITTANNGNPGNSVNAAGGSTGYLVNTGVGFDATESITGTFDFYIVENGNYTNGSFFFGDVQSGLSTTAGDHLRVDLREKTFGARANIIDADGTTVFSGAGNNLYEIVTNTWYSASFSWTPTSGSTGNFSFSWGAAEGPMTVTGYTLNSSEVFFGFGTVDDPARFDNISITGTEFVPVPEPNMFALAGLGGVLLLLRRRS